MLFRLVDIASHLVVCALINEDKFRCRVFAICYGKVSCMNEMKQDLGVKFHI